MARASRTTRRAVQPRRRPLGQIALAGLILIVAGYVLLHFVIGLVAFLATIVLALLAIAAVIWALHVLL